METTQGCVELTVVDPIEDSAEITVTTKVSETSLERNGDTSVDIESPHTVNAYSPDSGTEGLEGDKNRSEDYEINIDSEDEDLADDKPDDCCSRGVRRIKSSINRFTNKHKKRTKTGLYAFLLFLYIVYFSYALYYSFEGAITLFSITVFVVLCVVYMLVRDNFGDKIDDVICRPIADICERHWSIIKWVSAIVTLGLFVVWLVVDTSKNPSNMMSFVGFVVILVFCFVFSKHPDKVWSH
ncbi:solute carrier family 28 member 3-like [Ptychodera flava]|uniref:solute carrier family 28 member 3-like n=1 Tax=Ptychodera flava TaxID=63121 RepID=UPI00396A862D